MNIKSIVVLGLIASISACAPSSTYREEFPGMGINTAGGMNTSGMSNAQLKNEINHAYLDGELTAEQARKTHTQLDVKAHTTAEQIAVINRDRLSARNDYESRKEVLDVVRDVTRSGSSVVGDVRDVRNTISAIFR